MVEVCLLLRHTEVLEWYLVDRGCSKYTLPIAHQNKKSKKNLIALQTVLPSELENMV